MATTDRDPRLVEAYTIRPQCRLCAKVAHCTCDESRRCDSSEPKGLLFVPDPNVFTPVPPTSPVADVLERVKARLSKWQSDYQRAGVIRALTVIAEEEAR